MVMLATQKSSRIVFLGCFLCALARAEDTREQFVDLKYEVDPTVLGCPSALEFRSIVAQQLGYDPYGPGEALGVKVRVRPTEAGLEGTIDWSTAETNKLGERRFTSRSEDCQQMMATVGFVVAVQIQLMATEKASTTEPGHKADIATLRTLESGNSSSEPLRLVTLSMKSFDLHPASDSTGWSAMVGLGPSAGFGLAPHTLAQGRLFIALQYGWAGLEAGAEAAVPSSKRETYGGGFEQSLFSGTLAGCLWKWSIAACGVGKLGLIRVRGTGVDKSESPSGVFAQVGPRLAYSIGLGGHFVLLSHVEVLHLLTPWTVDLNHLVVWTMPRFSTVAGIDVAVRLQ